MSKDFWLGWASAGAVILLLSMCDPAQAEPRQAPLYYAGTHMSTEVLIKVNKIWSGEWEVSAYNRLLASLIAGAAAYSLSRDSDSPDFNATAAGLGVVTGNVLQYEW
jgi:hypothetical protein